MFLFFLSRGKFQAHSPNYQHLFQNGLAKKGKKKTQTKQKKKKNRKNSYFCVKNEKSIRNDTSIFVVNRSKFRCRLHFL